MNRRLSLLSLALAGLGNPVRSQTTAADLKIIVPTPAGGPSDAAARAVGQALARNLSRAVVIENRPGASGALAARAVLDARPDGQTLLWGLASMSGLPYVQKASPYRSMSEFTPIGAVGRFVFALFVPADGPSSVEELVSQARARPDALSCAHGTLGEMMAATQFMASTNTRLGLVPYKGGAQLMPDLISNRVQLNFGPLSSGLAHVRAGKLRALAVLSDRRADLLPDVPTLGERGVATGTLPTWQALFAPPALPADTTQTLSRTVAAVLQDTELRATLTRQGLQVEGGDHQALATLVEADATIWRRFVDAHGIAPA